MSRPLAVRLRSNDREAWLELEDGAKIQADEDAGEDFVAPEDVASRIGLASLRKQLIRHVGETWGGPYFATIPDPATGRERRMLVGALEPTPVRSSLLIVDAPSKRFYERRSYEFVPEPVSLVLREGGALAVRVAFAVAGEDQPDEELMKSVVQPILKRHRAQIDLVEIDPEGPISYRTNFVISDPEYWTVDVYVLVPLRGHDVGFALAVGREVLALLQAADGGMISASSALAMIEGGRAELLVGQPEGAWLECKRQPYGEDESGKDELAKDVVAFANSRRGGIIVLGLRTRRVDGRDVIVEATGFSPAKNLEDRIKKTVRQRVFPYPVGMVVRQVPHEARALLVISVPPQAAAMRPFMVKGRVRESRKVGAYVGVFTRHDDANVPSVPEELHALLAAGRAALGYDS